MGGQLLSVPVRGARWDVFFVFVFVVFVVFIVVVKVVAPSSSPSRVVKVVPDIVRRSGGARYCLKLRQREDVE